jgi:monooxygenase
MSSPPVDHVDVLIVGAGLTGIGAASHLQTQCPGKTFAILEGRADSGGTWDLFRYPGVRSDSDMFTLAYAFKPWMGNQAITDGPAILDYIRETAHDRGIDKLIRYNSRAVHASWSSGEARWTVEIERTDTGATELVTCNFLFGATGYYRYDEGYTPDFPGRDTFTGAVVHPQHWPEDLDCAGKRVVVIGSGATAVTLVPALAEQGAIVTMLQRSPSYIVSLPNKNPIDEALRQRLSPTMARRVVRWKNMFFTWFIFQMSRHAPSRVRDVLLKGVTSQLPEGYDVATHFTPDYQPWDQRMCFAPEGDLFTAISAGRASVVTGHIASFTATGVQLESGEVLEADVIVTATGLAMQMLGGLTIEVDGRSREVANLVAYKSLMLGGVPNLAFTFGYTNASWTLKSDLVARYVCRLLKYMDAHDYVACTPQEPDPQAPTASYLDLRAGYVKRGDGSYPKQGTAKPWRVRHNYPLDILMFRFGPVNDDVVFARRPTRSPVPATPVGAAAP